MKTIVVISDSHGNRAAQEKLYPIFAESDYIIHLGDTSGDGNAIKKSFPDKTIVLNGNCDIMPAGDREAELQVENIKILACHGDRYGVKSTLSRLAYRAEEVGAQIALYGHTHIPKADTEGGVTLLNPGTLSRYSANTYLYIVINGNKFTFKHVDLR